MAFLGSGKHPKDRKNGNGDHTNNHEGGQGQQCVAG
jgi:hypothetical protein